PAEAERYFRKAAALAPGEADVLAQIGLCLRQQKKSEEAEKVFRETLGLDPGNISALYALGQICDARDQITEAVSHFRKAKDLQSAEMLTKALSPRALPAVINRFRK